MMAHNPPDTHLMREMVNHWRLEMGTLEGEMSQATHCAMINTAFLLCIVNPFVQGRTFYGCSDRRFCNGSHHLSGE